MDQGPLVTEEIEAGTKFLSELEKTLPVKAAFWLKASEDDRRYLYVATDRVNNGDLMAGYEHVARVAIRLNDPNFDHFQVKLIGTDHPYAKAAIDLHERYPTRDRIRLNRRDFAGMRVDEGLLYPALIGVS